MPRIKIKITWYNDTPVGAFNEETTSRPRAIDTEKEAMRFRAGVRELMDNKYGEQPRTISWDGPYGEAETDR